MAVSLDKKKYLTGGLRIISQVRIFTEYKNVGAITSKFQYNYYDLFFWIWLKY